MTEEPGLSTPVPSVFVIERSADRTTGVVAVDALFDRSGSVDDEVTPAVLDRSATRLADTATVRWRVVVEPAVIAPRVHVTDPAESEPPLVAETNVAPAGTTSETETPVASEGPVS